MEKGERRSMRFSFRRRPKSISVDRDRADAQTAAVLAAVETMCYLRNPGMKDDKSDRRLSESTQSNTANETKC